MTALKKLKYLRKKLFFNNSTYYWQRRYNKGRNSGSGSYGKNAEFKANFLNDFCKKNKVKTVIEFGCGDGNQLGLANYAAYTGIDVSPVAIGECIKKFANDNTKNFFSYQPDCFVDNTGIFKAELAMSLDVIFHLTEDDIYQNYMTNLFNSAARYVIILSSNKDEKTTDSVHVRHHEFTKYVDENFTEWKLIETKKTPQINNSFADFYVYEKQSG